MAKGLFDAIVTTEPCIFENEKPDSWNENDPKCTVCKKQYADWSDDYICWECRHYL